MKLETDAESWFGFIVKPTTSCQNQIKILVFVIVIVLLFYLFLLWNRLLAASNTFLQNQIKILVFVIVIVIANTKFYFTPLPNNNND